MTDSVRTDENRVGIEIAGGLMIDRTKLTGEVKFSKNFYSSALRTRDPYLGCGSVLVQYWFSDRFDIELGMTGFYGRGTGSSLRKALHPIAGIRWRATPTMTTFAKYEPYVQQNTLALLLERNPYLMYTTPLMNTDFFLSYSAGMEIVGEIVKVKSAVSYKRAYLYPIFLDTVEKLWSVSYEGSTEILSIESTLYANFSAEDNLGVSFAFEKAKKESPGLQAGFESELPYHPRVLVGAVYQHRFPVGFAIESSVKFVGRRFADFLNTRMLRPVTFWDVKVEYRIKQQLSIGVTVENILEQQRGYWEGYVTQSRRAALLIAFSW
jgi:hypothetical protein